MALGFPSFRFLPDEVPFDPAAADAPIAPPRAFVLDDDLAARFAAVCAALGDAPAAALQDLIVLHCEEIESAVGLGSIGGEGEAVGTATASALTLPASPTTREASS